MYAQYDTSSFDLFVVSYGASYAMVCVCLSDKQTVYTYGDYIVRNVTCVIVSIGLYIVYPLILKLTERYLFHYMEINYIHVYYFSINI